jgi:hypothetical protein
MTNAVIVSSIGTSTAWPRPVLLHQLETLVRSRPVLMLFEDAHWADPTSRELLDTRFGGRFATQAV